MHPKKDGMDALPDFSLLKKAPDAVIISHAHLDHCGALPYLLKEFPSIVPYATKATLSVMDRMLHNSVSVMELLGKERGIGGYPLYTHRDVEFALRKTYGIDLDQEFRLRADSPVSVRFRHAGHVLGSASIVVNAGDHTIYYTGDICTYDQQLMPKYIPPDASAHIDTLIVESTNGAYEEGDTFSYQNEARRFCEAICEVVDDGGCVLVAAFALGRTQEVLNILVEKQEAGKIPDVPIYASGLGRAVYELYTKFSDQLRDGKPPAPLSLFGSVGNNWDEGLASELIKEPAIIVATSGMMIENTPSARIAEKMVADGRHGIFFVGYCDPDSLGYAVQHAKPGDRLTFRLGQAPVPIKTSNIRSFRFSAHAKRSDLLSLVDSVNAQNVIFVHGDSNAIDWMKEHCGEDARKFTPFLGETIHLTGAK